jgi:hypothetical protein
MGNVLLGMGNVLPIRPPFGFRTACPSASPRSHRRRARTREIVRYDGVTVDVIVEGRGRAIEGAPRHILKMLSADAPSPQTRKA